MAIELKAEADDVFDAAAEAELLERILAAYYSAVLAAVHQVVQASFVDVPGFDPERFVLEDSATVRLLGQAGTQIVRITETTRQAIASQLQVGAQRGYNTWQIAHGVPSEDYGGINGLFRETWAGRAEMVARTELQNAQRLAAIDRYNATGLVDEVELIDGDDWDLICADRNGKVVPLSQAPSLAHPRCTLVLVPVVRQGIAE
jgi:hypothetical protein